MPWKVDSSFIDTLHTRIWKRRGHHWDPIVLGTGRGVENLTLLSPMLNRNEYEIAF
jgi:hypothetical protein